jgi:hypothetical protein
MVKFRFSTTAGIVSLKEKSHASKGATCEKTLIAVIFLFNRSLMHMSLAQFLKKIPFESEENATISLFFEKGFD